MPEHDSQAPFDSPMRRDIFEAGGNAYTLGHVFSAAAVGGWTGGFWSDLEESLACAAYAGDEGFAVDLAELQSLADTFRYERRLVTAEETERWLAERAVDEDELAGYLERRYWHDRFCRDGQERLASYGPLPRAVAAVVWPEVVFSGCLGPLALPLARRVAAGAAGELDTTEARAAFFARTGCGPADLGDWLARNRCTIAWFEALLALEARYRHAHAEALSHGRCEEALEARRLDLMRVRFSVARFATSARAREAWLCITEDGEDFADAVRRAGSPAEEQALLLEDAPETLRAHLLSAAPGEVVLIADPTSESSIVRVVDKTVPVVTDPEILARLEPVLVSRYFDPLVEANVRWMVPLEPGP